MTKVKEIVNSNNFKAINIGKLEEIKNHVTTTPMGDINGKIFIKDFINSTGSEISFQTLPSKAESPFFHSHKQNEEIYIVLRGSGQFQIDEDVFDVEEGSIVRISPKGKRGIKNNSNKDMIFMVIQTKENSLEQYTMEDGVPEKVEAKW